MWTDLCVITNAQIYKATRLSKENEEAGTTDSTGAWVLKAGEKVKRMAKIKARISADIRTAARVDWEKVITKDARKKKKSLIFFIKCWEISFRDKIRILAI